MKLLGLPFDSRHHTQIIEKTQPQIGEIRRTVLMVASINPVIFNSRAWIGTGPPFLASPGCGQLFQIPLEPGQRAPQFIMDFTRDAPALFFTRDSAFADSARNCSCEVLRSISACFLSVMSSAIPAIL